ncbi:MAG: glucose-6-phosphate dehydrogenase [Gemmatimonadales bacterium]|nr:glucose-6-phosphate dehydrogenase [Gemmatimonadales bacterium]
MTVLVEVPATVPDDAPALAQPLKRGDACTVVIFGAAGDLSRRKLFPALFHLQCDGLLHEDFALVGVSREAMTDDAFRQLVYVSARDADDPSPAGEIDEKAWARFATRLSYVQGDLTASATFAAIGRRLGDIEAARDHSDGRLFYLAIPPTLYAKTVAHLQQSSVAGRVDRQSTRPWVRVVIEKPFGRDLESAKALNRTVRKAFAEHQVYRIDHYLGKETVQNLMVFRFANSIFEPVWNRHHIHHVQITAAETVGVEHRAGYYEDAGVVRDMFQNHLLQLMCLTAMEPPVAFQADEVRDEKTKVLRAIRRFPAAEMHDYSVRGQYGPGTVKGVAVPGYRQEPDVDPGSDTPTWAGLRLLVDNWRWQGVPFFLRSGKRMPSRVTEIAVQFREPPHLMFQDHDKSMTPNVIAIRVQPEEGISLSFDIKVPGVGVRMTAAKMDFSYAEAFGAAAHSAYETLLLDCMVGDGTLFTRGDAVEAAWEVVDPVIEAWNEKDPEHFPNYAAGSWGPGIADEFIARDGGRWRQP